VTAKIDDAEILAARGAACAAVAKTRPLKWRGWNRSGRSLGVCEAVNHAEAIEKLRAAFPETLEVVTTAFFGAEATV
jgi:hypothetical protein